MRLQLFVRKIRDRLRIISAEMSMHELTRPGAQILGGI
jgi:hypothetical protein